MTIIQIIILIVCTLGGIGFSVYIGYANMEWKQTIIGILVTVLIVAGIFGGFYWYNHSTASGMRSYGEYQKNLTNGVEREVYIYAEDGREIYHYQGKIDIDDTSVANCLYFYDQEGKSHIVHYGIQDTVIIIEK